MAPNVPIEFTGQKESKKYSFSQTMGKSRKYSKGLSSGFVPDNRHAVVTIGESEGFGSSARVDIKMSASEDSYALKRKCMSLNSVDSFGVPLQVLSLSKMSQSERKALESRLKMELEQIRDVQKKVSSMSSNVVDLAHSAIQSCSEGQNRGFQGNHHKSSEVSVSQGKKPGISGRNGPRTKGRIEPKKPVTASTSTSIASLMKQCEALLNRLMAHQFGWAFNVPVDVVKFNIPDYFTIIKHPMDLGTVKTKLIMGRYSSPLEFAADVRLTFSNAMTYNAAGNDFHFMAATLNKYFEARWKPFEKKIPLATDMPSREANHVENEATMGVSPLKKMKVTSDDFSIRPGTGRQRVTDEEKHKLSIELEDLLAELPESIIDFLKEHRSSIDGTSEDEIEIDIDALSDDTLFSLRRLLDDYLLNKQKNQAKAEISESEHPNDSVINNSSRQFSEGNDPVDEDVDIVGGNDPPFSSYPSLQIEKDATRKSSKCSSSSISTSASGSSSSDSGSGSSTESETHATKAVGSVSITKEISGVNTLSNQNRGNGVELIEENSRPEPISLKTDDNEEGESAPLERQVSPEKLYRAALLRNRFADTILKAREKALEKVEKMDPERLRIEREELERRQKEEKARLQAEAKAAEEARQRAEAEAAAEARRKRELEREAARQALQMMEKTVEINENSKFLEDLELFTASNDEPIPTFVEEASPDHSQKGLGSFKLQGSSNLLEQLGLYMKMDEEYDEDEGERPHDDRKPVNDGLCVKMDEEYDEDEGEQRPQDDPKPINDVEDGEID